MSIDTHLNILNFISQFSQFGDSAIECFTHGNCYWFAHILHSRFPNSEIMINNVENHFACKIDDKLYDITGEVELTDKWISWSQYLIDEPVHSLRIIDDCVLKEHLQ